MDYNVVMRIIFANAIGILWLMFIVYWAIAAQNVKRDTYRERNWWGSLLMFALVAMLVSGIWPALAEPIFPQTMPLGILALVLVAAGIGFAVWARVHLGKDWSSRPAVKEGHELVTSGPYRIVRHPIYTGIILAFIGTALVDGVIWDIMFLVVVALFIRRVRVEEKLMTDQFPEQYPDYKKRTKALIPFIW